MEQNNPTKKEPITILSFMRESNNSNALEQDNSNAFEQDNSNAQKLGRGQRQELKISEPDFRPYYVEFQLVKPPSIDYKKTKSNKPKLERRTKNIVFPDRNTLFSPNPVNFERDLINLDRISLSQTNNKCCIIL